jgi:hypothetical protein
MRAPKLVGLLAFASVFCGVAIAQREEPAPPAREDTHEQPAQPAPTDSTEQPASRFPGMDQSVNVDLAKRAGVPARKPYLDVESLGDLWNLILLTGGAVCGFVVGRYWDQIWGRRK